MRPAWPCACTISMFPPKSDGAGSSGRNAAPGKTYRMTVTRSMFDFIEAIWQPPSPEEMAALDGVRVA